MFTLQQQIVLLKLRSSSSYCVRVCGTMTPLALSWSLGTLFEDMCKAPCAGRLRRSCCDGSRTTRDSCSRDAAEYKSRSCFVGVEVRRSCAMQYHRSQASQTVKQAVTTSSGQAVKRSSSGSQTDNGHGRTGKAVKQSSSQAVKQSSSQAVVAKLALLMAVLVKQSSSQPVKLSSSGDQTGNGHGEEVLIVSPAKGSRVLESWFVVEAVSLFNRHENVCGDSNGAIAASRELRQPCLCS